MGDVLKQAAAAGGSSSMWGLFADYYTALGFHTSAREALLKQACHACVTNELHLLDASSGQLALLRTQGCTCAMPHVQHAMPC